MSSSSSKHIESGTAAEPVENLVGQSPGWSMAGVRPGGLPTELLSPRQSTIDRLASLCRQMGKGFEIVFEPDTNDFKLYLDDPNNLDAENGEKEFTAPTAEKVILAAMGFLAKEAN